MLLFFANHHLSHVVVEDANILCFVVMNWILDKCNACLIVNGVIISLSCENPNSSRNLLNQTPSHVVLDATIYSALVVESAIAGCFLFDQLIVAMAKRNTNPVVDH
jgi:hypothetical protein